MPNDPINPAVLSRCTTHGAVIPCQTALAPTAATADAGPEAQGASKRGPSDGRRDRAEPLAGPTCADAEAVAMSLALVLGAVVIVVLVIRALLEVLFSGPGPLSR